MGRRALLPNPKEAVIAVVSQKHPLKLCLCLCVSCTRSCALRQPISHTYKLCACVFSEYVTPEEDPIIPTGSNCGSGSGHFLGCVVKDEGLTLLCGSLEFEGGPWGQWHADLVHVMGTDGCGALRVLPSSTVHCTPHALRTWMRQTASSLWRRQ